MQQSRVIDSRILAVLDQAEPGSAFSGVCFFYEEQGGGQARRQKR